MKNWIRRIFRLTLALIVSATGFAGIPAVAEESSLAKVDNTKWQYNEEADVYWQVGISYCSNPADEDYETLGIFVPAAYMTAEDNGDGTYTCTVNPAGQVGDYTAETAPIVIPVNTPGYSAMAAPTGYESDSASYTSAGFIYVMAGCRGRDSGAPSGVTDLKAAVRYIRYCADELPGSTDRIFTFGMSGGGAQSALMGATGDSDLYTPYLEAIGAVEGYSDAVAGSMCWCPITNLDYADAAYEWNMGSTREDLDEDMQALSDGLAEAFAEYINTINLQDSDGNVLVLEESEDGIYQAGSYYDYILSVVEDSLNNFLEDTEFPYTVSGSSGGMGGMMGGRGGRDDLQDGDLPDGDLPEDMGDLPDGEAPDDLPDGEAPDDLPDGDLPDGEAPSDPANGDLPDGEAPADLPDGDLPDGEAPSEDARGSTDGGYVDENGDRVSDGILRTDTGDEDTAAEDQTYETAQDYIDSLNGDDPWITYDADTNTVSITSLAAFVEHCKTASKDVGAFDDLNRAQGENQLFGTGDGESLHFDSVMAELLADNETYGAEYAEDLTALDSLGTDMQTRINMYNPMYYLCEAYDGYQTSTVATYWRIRSGIEQGDTALTTEVNLALALEQYGDLDVDFETVWAQAHTQAERTGSASEQFIAWVNECLSE